MTNFTDAQIDLISKARKIVHREAVNGGSMNWDRFSDFDGLASFVRVAQFSNFLDNNLDMTRGGLRAVTAKLAEAHRAAADVTVGQVDDSVSEFVSRLRAIHSDIQADQNFRVASEMAADLATAIENHAASS